MDIKTGDLESCANIRFMNMGRNSACQTYFVYLLPTLKMMLNCLLNLKATIKISDLKFFGFLKQPCMSFHM